jgi:structure-specific recognition protein 1
MSCTDVLRESFNDIYLDLSKESGKCRIAESGLGWKPHNGETWTLDKAEIMTAQWSRAARGHELKIYVRKDSNVYQLDGFKQDVS